MILSIHPSTTPNPNNTNNNKKGSDYYGDDIFDWSVGAASLPAPPRRTLQRMGVPEQLRQFFLLKVRPRERIIYFSPVTD